MLAADHLYRRNLAGVHGGLLTLVGYLWQTYGGGGSSALYTMAAAVGAFTVRGQERSVMIAQSYLGGLTPAGAIIVDPGSALVGYLAGGSPVMQIAAMAVSLYWRRMELGHPEREAAESVRSMLANAAASEPYRVANEVVRRAAATNPVFTGRMRRVISPGACEFCRTIADHGYTPAAAGFSAHRYCQCTAAPEVRTA